MACLGFLKIKNKLLVLKIYICIFKLFLQITICFKNLRSNLIFKKKNK